MRYFTSDQTFKSFASISQSRVCTSRRSPHSKRSARQLTQITFSSGHIPQPAWCGLRDGNGKRTRPRHWVDVWEEYKKYNSECINGYGIRDSHRAGHHLRSCSREDENTDFKSRDLTIYRERHGLWWTSNETDSWIKLWNALIDSGGCEMLFRIYSGLSYRFGRILAPGTELDVISAGDCIRVETYKIVSSIFICAQCEYFKHTWTVANIIELRILNAQIWDSVNGLGFWCVLNKPVAYHHQTCLDFVFINYFIWLTFRKHFILFLYNKQCFAITIFDYIYVVIHSIGWISGYRFVYGSLNMYTIKHTQPPFIIPTIVLLLTFVSTVSNNFSTYW